MSVGWEDDDEEEEGEETWVDNLMEGREISSSTKKRTRPIQ
jgi:hypothetical protein